MGNQFSKVFGAIGTASVTKRGEYVRPGKYLFEVQAVRMFDGNSGPTHVTELIVREAEKTDPNAEPSPVGSLVSAVNVFAGKTAKVAPGKVKGFTEALYGVEGLAADIVATMVEETVNEDAAAKDSKGKPLAVNPCKGMLIRAYTNHFKSKTSDTEGENINWIHVPGQKKADIAARAAAQTG